MWSLSPSLEKGRSVEIRETPPAHLQMRIQSYSNLSKYGVWKCESREFEAGNYKWRLIIYPDGDECSKKRDHIAAYVSMADAASLPSVWEVNVIFNIFLFNQHLDKYLCFRGEMRRFNETNKKWGYSKLISKKIMRNRVNGYLVDDNCLFGAEVFVYKRQQVIQHMSISKTTARKLDWKVSDFSKLKGIWTSETFTVGGHSWHIRLHPNGSGFGKDSCVSIYLRCRSCQRFAPHQRVMTNFTISIKNNTRFFRVPRLSKSASHGFTSSASSFGFPKFISIADMFDPNKGFVVDDCFFLRIIVCVRAVVL